MKYIAGRCFIIRCFWSRLNSCGSTNIMYLRKVQGALISVLLLLGETNELLQTCPVAEKIVPCICYYEGVRIKIECENVDQNEFERAMTNLRGYEIQRITILKSRLKVIIPGTFKRMNVRRLEITESEVEHFFLFQALQGLEFSLELLKFINLKVKYWKFSSDWQFIYLEKFHMRECPENQRNETDIIRYLPDQLTLIGFNHCSISSEEEFSFRRFFHLEWLSLNGNRLTSVRRSLVLRPASFLKVYILSGNPITDLPYDMFEDMPALRTVSLQNTLLTTLDYDIFMPVLFELQSLRISNIPLICNCKALWLLTVKTLLYYGKTTCQEPATLKNKNIINLSPTEMCPILRNKNWEIYFT